MKQITVNLPDNLADELQNISEKLGVKPEDLLLVSLQEKIAHTDEAFSEAMTRVLKKNAELYRRLAS